MGSFLTAPVFLPIQAPLPNGTAGQVLTIGANNQRVWAAGGGGGSAIGTYFASSATTGVFNNFAIAAGVGRLDLDTTTGDIELTGITAGTDGQLLIVRNKAGTNNVILDSENAGSTAANRMQLPGQMFLPLFDSFLLCYYAGTVNRWCMAG